MVSFYLIAILTTTSVNTRNRPNPRFWLLTRAVIVLLIPSTDELNHYESGSLSIETRSTGR